MIARMSSRAAASFGVPAEEADGVHLGRDERLAWDRDRIWDDADAQVIDDPGQRRSLLLRRNPQLIRLRIRAGLHPSEDDERLDGGP
jgi:hypothetical protein